MTQLRLAVVGAGAIGRKHIELVVADEAASLAAIVDPGDAGRELAARLATPWFASLEAMLDAIKPDGVILATPNHLHASGALAAIARGVPALVEKPVATGVDDARRVADAAAAANVPVLVGHHRRHNPIIRAARDCVASGRLGRLTAIAALTMFYKPDAYFDIEWRRSAQAGPVLVNLVHGVDDLRFICGDIVDVQAFASRAARGHEAEDTAAVVMRFACGALGTFLVSDSAVAPWSWELASGETMDYPRYEVGCYSIGGTEASLSLPGLEVWSYGSKRGWNEDLRPERLAIAPANSLETQLRHFLEVIRGAVQPVCGVEDAIKSLATIEHIRQAARSSRGREVRR